MSATIHSTAIIDPKAKIAENVSIGPYSVIGPEVEIGEGTWIGPHVVINGWTKIGKDNKIFQFSSIGEEPQDYSYKGDPTRLEIGDRNVIRESVTISRGTTKAQGLTKIGNDNWLLAYAHVAHDCLIHNHALLSNNASLAGHVIIHDHALIGALSAIHQHCEIGAYAFVARAAMIPNSVPPYILVSGNDPKLYGINQIALERKGFSKTAIKNIWQAYKILYRQKLSTKDALEKIQELVAETSEVQVMIDFIKRVEESGRGIIR